MSGSNTRAGNGVGALLFLAGFVVLAIVIANTLFSPDEYSESNENPNDDDNLRFVVLAVAWGHYEDTGEVWPDTGEPKRAFRADERQLTIRYWVDDVEYSVPRDHIGPGTWNDYLVLARGTRLRLLVEQDSAGGFLMCTMSSNGKTLLPNGYMHRNDAGDCDINGVVE